ncbi:4Fe-4S dicluster domain-containing protein, partial [Treponema endosymbiont of Eucomonympha sp.]|uniref:4Fe-4S dicluster domain-containing protein n=1 Tax=Treponema endosymbiont of Eucomonympha sp. TaxID=1580831 RepID=UPI00164FD279
MKKAHEKGLPVVIMEPLLGGKLAGSLPEAVSEAFRRVDPARSNAAWAFRWLWEQAEVTVVLSGMSEFRQLAENAALADSAAAGMLSDTERDAYRLVIAEFNKSYKIRCTGCNYCMPCPRGVNIPSCFAAYNTSFSLGFFAGMQQYTTSTGATSIKPSGAGLCVQFGKCETHCPQRLPIRESLKAV